MYSKNNNTTICRCTKWIVFSGNSEVCIENAKKYRICAHHFEDNQFANPVKKVRLRRDALPTKNEWVIEKKK